MSNIEIKFKFLIKYGMILCRYTMHILLLSLMSFDKVL